MDKQMEADNDYPTPAEQYELSVMAAAVWQLRNYCLVTGKTIMEIDNIGEFRRVCEHPCGYLPESWLVAQCTTE